MSHEFKSTIARIPENVHIHDFLRQDDFKEILAKNEFYLQLSLTEGFPNSLCEGMLSGCIPVGSHVGAIPLIIGETGIVINKYDYSYIAEEFSKIIQIPDDERLKLSSEARERIASNFNISRREQAFLEIILKHTISN
jgi:glycosyltransferase involved in cell wall biosynthesis